EALELVTSSTTGYRPSPTYRRCVPASPGIASAAPPKSALRAARSKLEIGPHRDPDEPGHIREREHDARLLAPGAHAHGDPVAPWRETDDVAALAPERVVVHLDRRVAGDHIGVAVAGHREEVARPTGIEALREHEHWR